MSGLAKIRQLLRRPTRREGISLVLVLLLVALFNPLQWYDERQRSVTAALTAKAYEGDGVVIAIDAKTERELSDKVWSRTDLAQLLAELNTHSPGQIVIGPQYFDEGSPAGLTQLSDALEALPQKPAWHVDLAPGELASLGTFSQAKVDGPLAPSSTWLNSEIAHLVDPMVVTLRAYRLGAPIQSHYGVETSAGLVPSAARVLAGETALPEGNEFDIDISYDPKTVPKISAIDVLKRNVDPTDLRGKKLIIASTERLGVETVRTPHEDYSSRAALTVIAAQTLKDGSPRWIGWVPSLLVAIVAAVLWFVLPRPYGRLLALATFLAIFISPFILEQYLIYQATSYALCIILLVAAGKFWQRGREAIQVYRSAAETKSQFLAQASHDLRQPIHAIGLLADRLTHTDLSTDQQEIVSKISWSVDNARRMFRALLDIAAIESGTLQKEIGAVSVNELLAEVDSQNALAAEQANVDLRLVPSDLVIETDRALAGTMLQNLVSNAIRYSPGGRIVVGCRRQGERLSFLVVDNGRGISPDELENVQQEFYRSDARSNLSTVNKGLGLAIVNRLAGMLGLRFELQSEQGKGTAAVIHGLLIVDARTSLKSSSKDKKLPLAGLRVVLADDDPETLESTGEVLQRWGCTTVAFSELPEKVPACDIVLSDFDFGFAGTLAERDQALFSVNEMGAQLIIISGHHPEQIREYMPGHTGLILTKPLRAAQLRSALMSLRTSGPKT